MRWRLEAGGVVVFLGRDLRSTVELLDAQLARLHRAYELKNPKEHVDDDMSLWTARTYRCIGRGKVET